MLGQCAPEGAQQIRQFRSEKTGSPSSVPAKLPRMKGLLEGTMRPEDAQRAGVGPRAKGDAIR